MLQDPDEFVRCSAVEALAELNPPELADCLRPMLEDDESDVCETVARVLEKSAARQDQ